MKTIFKNIFTGIGSIALAIAIIVGLIAAFPVLLVAGGALIQVGGWVLLFGIVIILPIWGVGKIRNTIKNRQKPVKLSDEEHEVKLAKAEYNLHTTKEKHAKTVDGVEEDYDSTIKAEYEEKYKEALRAKYEQEYNDKMAKINLKKTRKEAFDRKISNLKSKAKTFKSDVTEAVIELVK